MKLLIDTATARGQILLDLGSQDFVTRSWQKEGAHSEKLTVELQSLLSEAQVDLADIEQYLVVTGPGSFTGIRVGINCVKTLAYTHAKSIIPINTLWALAYSHKPQDGTVMSLLDAQRNSVFASSFQCTNGSLEVNEENLIVSIDDLASALKDVDVVCGSGWPKYKSVLPNKFSDSLNYAGEWIDLTKVANWATTHGEKFAKQWEQVQPLYLRKSAAEEKFS